MKLGAVAVFAAGYVIGAKAGRERYGQIVDGMARASQGLEQFSARRPPGSGPPSGPGRPSGSGCPSASGPPSASGRLSRSEEQRSGRPDGGP